MSPRAPAIPVVLLLAVCWTWTALFAGQDRTRHPDADPPPARIVSVVPAATEILFAIGAGPQVIAVSSYDRFPPEVEGLPRVGALVDPDLERILALEPDLVVAYATQRELVEQLTRASVDTYRYAHGDLDDIWSTIRDLGRAAGRLQQAERLVASIEARLDTISRRIAGRQRPRVLLVFGRDAGSLRGVYASGGYGFLHDMLERAGGRNVFDRIDSERVQVTLEEILAASPEVIIELRATLSADAVGAEERVWDALPALPAVRTGRVDVLTGEELVVPGPRVADAVDRLARVLHPDAF